MLDITQHFLEANLDDSYHIFSQTKLGPFNAYRRFIKSKNPVLLGLYSFWEGVDVKGDRLRLVVIVKLPFRVPDEPILKAQIKKANEKNLNPFMTIQVPQAVLRFKQGFGRLIRSKQDKGIVAVMDSRLQTKSYGKEFLGSIPKTKIASSVDDIRILADKITQNRNKIYIFKD
jgi:ATP-dependent DNA helicase DinG